MAHGGARKGAGRKVGALTQKTREIAERAVETGITPLDYMLEILRDTTADAGQRFEAAKAAAPYIHPRLSAVDATVEGGLRIEIIDSDDDD
jgi:methanogenic corrinoid protein MtbC1